MKWANPISPTSITGQQTLTGDAPITNIHRAIQELQDAVVAKASVDVGGQPAPCFVRDNTLFVSLEAAAGSGSSSWVGTGTILVITGVTAALSVDGTSTLKLTLSFTGKTLNLATGATEDADIEDATATLEGVDCDE